MAPVSCLVIFSLGRGTWLVRRILILSAFATALLISPVGCTRETSPPVGLKVTNTAPELEGADAYGKKLRLSDYRGQVVVVDFWATWCGPCREMIPHNIALVERMKGKPFVLLGVSADSNADDLRQFLDRGNLPYPSIFDGRMGPIAAAWKIEYFPTIFVIDHKGVIRYKDLHGRDLDRAVERLVQETEAAGGTS